MKTTTSTISNPINDSMLRWALILIPFVLMCVATLPGAQAVVPAPDGGYPGGNTAEGDNALFSLTTGEFNTAEGLNTLGSNTTGFQNTATGVNALIFNTTGSQNTATGVNALFSNTTGFQNAATGVQALFNNTTGFHNAATGFQALLANRTGNHNTADGDNALVHDTTGSFNTAIGAHALDQNVIGSANVALGFQAGFNITGNGNICIGQNIVGVAGESNVTRIGNIGSTAQANGVLVTVGAGGKLGFQASSRRYKDDIKPMDKASEALFALKPVSFRYKQEIDPARSPDFGLIAEDVATVNPDLVARDEEGKIVTVRYQAINAMLLNEFLKEHRTVQEQKANVTQLKQDLAKQQKQIEALTAGLQKVSAQLEVNKRASETVCEQSVRESIITSP
jgi:Chaperone of endosialidase